MTNDLYFLQEEINKLKRIVKQLQKEVTELKEIIVKNKKSTKNNDNGSAIEDFFDAL